MDIKLELDKFIETYVYGMLEPEEDCGFSMVGWSKERDGRFYLYEYSDNTRGFFSVDDRIDMWPRKFSDTSCLALELMEMFLITLAPLINIDNVVLGWRASHINSEVEDKSASMAVCLLIYKILKNKGY